MPAIASSNVSVLGSSARDDDDTGDDDGVTADGTGTVTTDPVHSSSNRCRHDRRAGRGGAATSCAPSLAASALGVGCCAASASAVLLAAAVAPPAPAEVLTTARGHVKPSSADRYFGRSVATATGPDCTPRDGQESSNKQLVTGKPTRTQQHAAEPRQVFLRTIRWQFPTMTVRVRPITPPPSLSAPAVAVRVLCQGCGSEVML